MKYRVPLLYEYALQPEHRESLNPHVLPTSITDTGALSVSSGLKTGRTPKEKRVVLDETTKDVSLTFTILMLLFSPFGGETLIFLFPLKDMQETEGELLTS
jgi:hypothetical protein